VKKENTGLLGCVGIVIAIAILIRFWYIFVIGLGLIIAFTYRKSIKNFYHKHSPLTMLIGCLTIIFMVVGIALTEAGFTDNNSTQKEKVAKTSDADNITEESSQTSNYDDEEESDQDLDDDVDESSSKDEDSIDDYDTENYSSDSDVSTEDTEESSSIESSSTSVSSQTGEWTTAPSGMVFVSDSNLYYSMVKNSNNFVTMPQKQADSEGAHRAPRGNEYARP
jgi:hypothetical protein